MKNPPQEIIDKCISYYSPDDIFPEGEFSEEADAEFRGDVPFATLHFVGYATPPNEICREDFVRELQEDPAFSDIAAIFDQVEIWDAPLHTVNYFANIIRRAELDVAGQYIRHG
jgi:hypothetical protein